MLKLPKISIGSWIQFAQPAHAEILAKSGFDWLAVDLEHSVISLREAEDLIRIIDLCKVVPLVRMSSNNCSDCSCYGCWCTWRNRSNDKFKR